MEARISGVIQRLGLLPANKILAGFRQCLAGFLESDLSLEEHRRLHRLKPEKKRLESCAVWSKRSSIESDNRSCCSSRRCEEELELLLSFTPATIKCAFLTAFLKRSNREDLKTSLVRIFSTQGSFQTGERCASRECIPTCGSSVKTWYANSPFSLRRSPMLTRHTTLERS